MFIEKSTGHSETALPLAEIRDLIRKGEWTAPTAGLAPGHVQANLVILQRDWAFDFLLFCQRNPKPCPLLDVTEPGSPIPAATAPDADIRTDLPRYRVWKDGRMVEERIDISDLWKEDLVGFLLGCSFSFEQALLADHIPMRHIELNRNVPMYVTSIPCISAGRLKGPMVVSMRPIPASMVPRAVTRTAIYPAVHGAPVHVGNPEGIGITDLGKPDFGESVPVYEGELPVFWACGVTPQAVLMASKPPFAITHAPGYMFIADREDREYAVL